MVKKVQTKNRVPVKSATELGIKAKTLGISKIAKTHKGRKILENRAAKLFENPKRSVFLKGRKSSQTLNTLMRELHIMRGTGMSQMLCRKAHDISVFEDVSLVERTTTKYDCSLFMVATHQKKRPDNLAIGRVFDGHVLDLFEVGIEDYKSTECFKSAEQIDRDLKPILIFQGEPFENSDKHKRFKNLMTGKQQII